VGLIDTLAYHYKWSKNDILNTVYFDEALEYLDVIKRRNIIQDLTQLAIVANPHTKNPKELYTTLQRELKKLQKHTIIDVLPEKGAFDKMRSILGSKGK